MSLIVNAYSNLVWHRCFLFGWTLVEKGMSDAILPVENEPNSGSMTPTLPQCWDQM